MKYQKGFSLIELLVVIAIIGILSMIGLMSFSSANAKARDSRRAADIQQVRSALELFRSDCGNYPATTDWSDLMSADFACNSTAPTDKNFLNSYLGGRPINDPQAAHDYNYSSTTDSEYTISHDTEVPVGTETYTNP